MSRPLACSTCPPYESGPVLLADWRRDVGLVADNVLVFSAVGGTGRPPREPNEDAVSRVSYLEVGTGWFLVGVGGDNAVDLRVQVWSSRPQDVDESWEQWRERRWSSRWTGVFVTALDWGEESPVLNLGTADRYVVRVAARGHLTGLVDEDIVEQWLVQIWPLVMGDKPRRGGNPPARDAINPLPSTGWLTWLEWTIGSHWLLYDVKREPLTMAAMKGADQTRRSHSAHYWDAVLVGPTEEGTEREAAAVLVGLPLRTRSDMLQFLEAVGYLERSNESGIERWAVRALPSRVDDVLDGRWWSVRTALEAEGLTPR